MEEAENFICVFDNWYNKLLQRLAWSFITVVNKYYFMHAKLTNLNRCKSKTYK